MLSHPKYKKLLILSLLLASFLGAFLLSSQAETDLINVTVQISVCGDGQIGGNEECDGSNLNGQTCQGLGYSSGSLSCDNACEFITSACTSGGGGGGGSGGGGSYTPRRRQKQKLLLLAGPTP